MSEPASYEWDAHRVRALRRHLGASQQQLAARLGTRQQTVSEWETASSRPRRMSQRLLTLVADEVGFYDPTTEAAPPEAHPSTAPPPERPEPKSPATEDPAPERPAPESPAP